MRSSLERKVWGSNLGPVKWDLMLSTAPHRYDLSSIEAALSGRNDAEMGPAKLLHASSQYSEYSERDLLNLVKSSVLLHLVTFMSKVVELKVYLWNKLDV